jgi:hypothetical protein
MSKKTQQHFCLSCNKEIPFKGYTYHHKYCDNQCQANYTASIATAKWRPLWEEGKDIGRPRQRKFLTEERGYKCECCGLSDWQGKEITLQVDHIDGDSDNNHKSNLRLICPNCHSQTETFAGANKGKGRWSKGLKKYYEGKSFSHGLETIGLIK